MSTVPFTRTRQTPLPNDLAQKLPSNLDAERSLLGALLLDNSAIRDIATLLNAEDFFLAQHKAVFAGILNLTLELLKKGEQIGGIDLVTLREYLEREGKLQDAGDTPYLASLIDGIPRVSNVKHYAGIIIEKAKLRSIIHKTHAIQLKAFEHNGKAEEILDGAAASLSEVHRQGNENPAVVIGFKTLLVRECAPQDFAIEPLLTNRGTGEIFGARGMGKSMIATWMAMEIAKGKDILWGGHRGAGGHWPISRPFRQLYVYGEMDESEVQSRARTFARMMGTDVPSDEQLGTMCMDYQKGWRPKISSARDRRFIEDRIASGDYEGLWLDNLSTLWPSSSEAESERDAILAEWYTDLNQRGIWVIWLHHAGKSGEQRGGSAKEDMLSFVLKLRTPGNYKKNEGLRVECHVDKNRHKSTNSRMLSPFEIHLTRDEHAVPVWVTRPAQAAQRAAAFEMFKNDMPTVLVAQDLGISRATAYRWKKDWEENPNPDFHTETDPD